MMNQSEVIQWRNIRSAVRQVADFCFGNQNDPKWGTAWLSVAHSLTAADGLELKGLEPLPNMTVGEPTGLYVVERADGCYLAIDSHSGGYPWWPDNIGSAEKFTANDRAVAYINTLSASERGDGVVVRQLMLGAPMSTSEFVDIANQDIRKTALAKLTAVERQALGLK